MWHWTAVSNDSNTRENARAWHVTTKGKNTGKKTVRRDLPLSVSGAIVQWHHIARNKNTGQERREKIKTPNIQEHIYTDTQGRNVTWLKSGMLSRQQNVADTNGDESFLQHKHNSNFHWQQWQTNNMRQPVYCTNDIKCFHDKTTTMLQVKW